MHMLLVAAGNRTLDKDAPSQNIPCGKTWPVFRAERGHGTDLQNLLWGLIFAPEDNILAPNSVTSFNLGDVP